MWVAHVILVSAQGPNPSFFFFWGTFMRLWGLLGQGLGLGLGQGLTILRLVSLNKTLTRTVSGLLLQITGLFETYRDLSYHIKFVCKLSYEDEVSPTQYSVVAPGPAVQATALDSTHHHHILRWLEAKPYCS